MLYDDQAPDPRLLGKFSVLRNLHSDLHRLALIPLEILLPIFIIVQHCGEEEELYPHSRELINLLGNRRILHSLRPSYKCISPASPVAYQSSKMSSIPFRTIAGIAVPDTPLITKSLDYAQAHLSEIFYNHVVRSWLFGFAIASKVPSLASRDLELHSIAAILHDLGWDNTGTITSKDKRFEVDGANAARSFIEKESEAQGWDRHRLQLLWDAIALHTTLSIAWEKEPEVATCSYGILADFGGPPLAYGSHLSWDEWDAVVKEYPRLGLKEGVKEVFCGLCKTKPETTYDNLVGQYGERFVDGYSLEGRRMIDLVENSTLP